MGERAVLIELADVDQVHRLWRSLRADRPDGIEEIVAGATTVLLVMQPGRDSPIDEDGVRQRLSSATVVPGAEPREIEIPVVYDGPDLHDVASMAGLSPREVARRHAGCRYTVGFVGFSPGFAYLVGGDPRLRVPRLATPRKSVPAGSVAVAADMTAVYPQATPGGWRIIGRTDVVLFDPSRADPSTLGPGDRVRFLAAEGQPEGSTQPVPESAEATVAGPPHAYVKVLDSGWLTTIQDQGRMGWAHLGVSRAGAADAASAAQANRLVGNHPDAALMEATLVGPRLLLGAAREVAITGGRADTTVDGFPARQDVALLVPAGSEITVGRLQTGARVYIALAGGLDVEPVLGSRSTDTLSGLGHAALAVGDVLPLGRPGPAGPNWIEEPGQPGFPFPEDALPAAGDLITVDARRGPRDDWVGAEGMEVLGTAEFVVSASSDRTGLRLEGRAVGLARTDDLPSEGMVAGAVQIPPGGRPMVLLRNHQTTGGYPVAAVVTERGVDRLAQAGPGVRVRFRLAP